LCLSRICALTWGRNRNRICALTTMCVRIYALTWGQNLEYLEGCVVIVFVPRPGDQIQNRIHRLCVDLGVRFRLSFRMCINRSGLCFDQGAKFGCALITFVL
jgi:hypothetical protein